MEVLLNSFTVFNSTKLEVCRICGERDFAEIIDLGHQPPSNSFLNTDEISQEKKFPLIVKFCNKCSLAQLSEVVSETEIFTKYAYRSSSSRALFESFKDLATNVQDLNISIGNSSCTIYDLGCNDGLALEQYSKKNFNLIGVEPSNIGLIAKTKGFKIYNDFFGKKLVAELIEDNGKADFITTSNVLAHVPDITDFVFGVRDLLKDTGVWIIEFPYLHDLFENNCFDTIYHEHMSYLSLTPLKLAFGFADLEIFNVQKKEIGGSGPYLRVYVKKKTNDLFKVTDSVDYYINLEKIYKFSSLIENDIFSKRIYRLLDVLRDQINLLHKSGLKMGAFGAPAKGNTLLNSLGLGSEVIVAAADNTLEKIGLLTPGMHVPVVSDKEFIDLKIDAAILLSWNYLSYFQSNSSFFLNGGKFINPFPYPRVIRNNL
jgi:hypothetical protein